MIRYKLTYLKVLGLLLSFVPFLSLAQNVNTQSKEKKGLTNSNIDVIRNIRYGNPPDGIGQDTSSDRLLDLYRSSFLDGKELPVILFIHGGGFAGGDKRAKGNEMICMQLANEGFVVISMNYYLTLKHEKTPGASCSANMAAGIPNEGFHPKLQKAIQDASADAQAVLKWIKRFAGTYKLDLSRVAISGGSAGAMTALYTAYMAEDNPVQIKAVIDFWGGLEKTQAIQKNNSPALLAYHGDQDELIHVDYAYALKDRLDELGQKQSFLHVMKGKGHARYDIISKEKIPEISEFLKQVLAIQ